jgi:hypothetical protein
MFGHVGALCDQQRPSVDAGVSDAARGATDSASGNHRISRPVAVAVKAVALAAGFTRRRLCG